MKLFKDLNLDPKIQQTIDQLGFTEPTEIQGKSIPILIEQKTIDFHGQAQTGTGKTIAFGIPLFHRIDPSIHRVQALIVAPTRELVLQICESLKPFAQAMNVSICTIYGGNSMFRQIQDLKRGAQIVVGTPGRLNDLLRRKNLSLKDLQTLVLDEADIMLDMGFKEEIDEILKYSPENRNIWLFSATVKSGINDIKKNYMKNVVVVSTTNKKNIGTQNTKQFFCVVPMNLRLEAVCRIIDSDPEFYGFIFCPTKVLTGAIAEKLAANGYTVNSLHGDMDQSLRTRVIGQFRDKKFKILVATDVAARGIDVSDLTHVVNYTLPNDQDGYLHRIGRTGRAGKTGIAISFVSNSEIRKIKTLTSRFGVDIKPLDIPTIADVAKVRITKVKDYILTIKDKTTSHKNREELNSILSEFSPEDLKNIAINLLSEKFLKSVQEKDVKFGQFREFDNNRDGRRDRDGRGRDSRGGRDNRDNSDKLELEINVGSDDGLTAKDVLSYLTEKGNVARGTLGKIKILRRKTFIILPNTQIRDLPSKLSNTKLQGREVRVAINNLS